jgi:hypothetical protein
MGVDTCTPFNMAATKEETIGLKGVHKTFNVCSNDLLMMSSKRQTQSHTCGKKITTSNKVPMEAFFVNTDH